MAMYFFIASACAFMFTLVLLIANLLNSDNSKIRSRVKRQFSAKQNNSVRRKAYKKNENIGQTQLSMSRKALKSLATELSCAGMRFKAEEYIVIWAIAAFLPAGMSQLWGADWMVALALILAGAIIPAFIVKRKKTKRLALLDQQLSDALIIVSNCLRTGLSFHQAMDSIARDMPEPISKEFARVSREMQLGLSMEKALENMVERVESKDFMMIVSAVLIQRQVGGNLSEILDSISDTIRDRLKIKASIKVLTASGRTSGLVVGLMPVFLMGILMLINPPYIKSFFESEAGTIMLLVGGVLEIIGFLTVKKVVTIKF